MGEAALTSVWRIRACLRQGGLSRNKVSVGEPADGSPPKKPEAGVACDPSLQPFFYRSPSLLFTPLGRLIDAPLGAQYSIKSRSQLGFNGRSEREQHQLWSLCVHGNGCSSIEMNFIPTVGDNVTTMHV